jgi:hypothetical protein
MPLGSSSAQEHQRLLLRFNHLLRRYETLSAVAAIYSLLAEQPASQWLNSQAVGQQLVEQRAALERGDLDSARRGLGAVEGALLTARDALQRYDAQVSAYILRARYQTPEARREEVAALLRFQLAKSPREPEDRDKLDYLATRLYALSCRPDGDAAGGFENPIREEYQEMLDQAGIESAGSADPQVLERLQFFREEFGNLATFEQLSTQGTLDRLREFKAELEEQWFYPEALVEIARTNVFAGQQFQQLANRERQRIDDLATRLLAAGVSEIAQPEGAGTLPVDDAREISALNASLLDQDYPRNKERLIRIAQLKESLERAHELAGGDAPPTDSPDRVPAAAADETPEELAAILEELSPTPDRLQQDLRARIARLSLALSAAQAGEDEIGLALDNSTLELAFWECAAFQPEPAPELLRETRLRRLLRVSVALMAELQEKAELICRGVTVGRLRNAYLIGARYLVQLSQQTARELELRCVSAEQPLPREACEQLNRTRRKLLDSCSQFSARIRSATL